MAKKNVTVEIELEQHGVPPPSLKDVKFLFHREIVDEDGIYNPVDGEGTYQGAFQVNIHANSDGYRELGKYFLALAEYDVGGDAAFHMHHEPVMSADRRTRLHVIIRKDDERYSDL
jgi:hypothetical protein